MDRRASQDMNLFWRLDLGQIQNLLDEAIERIDELEEALEVSQARLRAEEATSHEWIAAGGKYASQLTAVRALHRPVRVGKPEAHWGGCICPTCGLLYPCPTIRAIDEAETAFIAELGTTRKDLSKGGAV
jgi:hypothetical protein